MGPRRRRILALVAGAVALAMTPVMAGAAPLTSAQIYEPIGFFRVCADAQIPVANISESVMESKGISIGGTIYESLTDDFQWAKGAVDIDSKRIMTAGWVDYFDEEQTQPRMIRCKLRTGESLNEGAWPPGTPNNAGPPGSNTTRFVVDPYWGFGSLADGVSTSDTDQQCTSANQNTIDRVWDSLGGQQATAAFKVDQGKVVTVPDTVVFDGPDWLLTDQPPLVRTAAEPDVLKVSARALVVKAYESGGPGPRFEGTHYCTFVAPQYLRDAMLGNVTVPVT